MKKGIFGNWFRELATLIFTQTVQAFLLAIIMAIVISALSSSGNGGDPNTNYAAGMLAIIALSQFGKVEMLVKNIFGVTSQFGDPAMGDKNPLTAGKLIAMKAGSRLLDNGKKAVGGAWKSHVAKRDIKNLNGELETAKELDEAKANEEKERIQSAQNKINNLGGTDAYGIQAASRQFDIGNVPGAPTEGNSSGGLGIPSASLNQLIAAVNLNTQAVNSAAGKGAGAVGGEKPKSEADKVREKIKEAENRRKEGRKEMASGIVETVAAVPGTVAGAGVGLASAAFTGANPLDAMAQGAITGAGLGDALGGQVVKTTNSVIDDQKAKKEIINQINNNIKQVQEINTTKVTNNARATNPGISDKEIEKIGQEAAKQSYDKMKDDFKNGYAQGNYGKDYKTISDRASNKGGNIKEKVQGVQARAQKKKIDKAANKVIKDVDGTF